MSAIITTSIFLVLGAVLGLVLARIALAPRLVAANAETTAAQRERDAAQASATRSQQELGGVRRELSAERDRAAGSEASHNAVSSQLAEANGRLSALNDHLDLALKKQRELEQENTRLDERIAEGEKARFKLDAERAEFDRQRKEHNDLVTSQVLEQLANNHLVQVEEGRKTLTVVAEERLGSITAPFAVQLTEVRTQLRELETRTAAVSSEIRTELQNTAAASTKVSAQAQYLGDALSKPKARGNWGEMHLATLLEQFGMTEHCDFETQVSVPDGKGGFVRPDVVMTMAGQRKFPVDSKVPMDAYNAVAAATSEVEIEAAQKAHVEAVRRHIDDLARRDYPGKIEHSAGFTVLYLPIDGMLSVAVEGDPDLYEYAYRRNVLLISQSSVLGLIKILEFGWRQAAVADNLQQITALGREVYERMVLMGNHLGKLGRSLTATVLDYNKLVGNIESTVLPAARRFPELGVSHKTIVAIDTIEKRPRAIRSAELLAAMSEGEQPENG